MKPPTFVLELPVKPIPGSDASGTATGAYANVFVLAANVEAATDRAISELKDAGWNTGEDLSIRQVIASDFQIGSSALEHFAQCQVDGLVISLHTWRTEH
jgi:hypothetical protein